MKLTHVSKNTTCGRDEISTHSDQVFFILAIVARVEQMLCFTW
jgi:hypothetical protein